MDHKIVNTAYVPLQPPYQIIKYDQDVAMQIGTLIVTIQKVGETDESNYKISTHSHPVVSYENKDRDGMDDNQLTNHQFLEGAVWNNVEVRDVTTVCLAGATLTWKQFLEVLEYESFLHMYRTVPDVKIYWGLKKLGVRVLPPEERECIVQLGLRIQQEESGLSLQSEESSQLFLNVSVAEDETDQTHIFYKKEKQTWYSDAWKEEADVWRQLTYQLFDYRHVLRDLLFNEKDNHFTVVYTTDEERFQKITDNLNITFTELSFIG